MRILLNSNVQRPTPRFDIRYFLSSQSENIMFAGIGKPIFDCDTLSRYKKPPCGVFQTHGAHVWVSITNTIRPSKYVDPRPSTRDH